LQNQGRLGAQFKLGDRSVTVMFDTTGPLAGRLTIRTGRRTFHDAPFPLTTTGE
jgi:hypothetical protein